jgi:hypothetical protein
MALEVFSEIPELDGFDYTDRMPKTVFSYSGSGVEQRAALIEIPMRRYSWPLRRIKSERDDVDTFFLARSQGIESFLVKDPDLYARTGVSLGTAAAAQVAFPLPATGENRRDYPIDDAHVEVYEDGTPTGATITVDTDGRSFTLSAAPGAGVVMTADYWFYRRVKLADDFTWRKLAPDYLEAVLALQEVVE